MDEYNSFKIQTEEKETIIDFQGNGKQIVGPGSTHPNGNKYKVVEDIEINYLKLSELLAVFHSVFPNSYLPQQYQSKNKKEIKKSNNQTLVAEIKDKYSIKELLEEQGINTNKNPTECPLHSSKGGKCLSFKNDVWHCFHCDESGDVLTLYQKIYNLDFKQTIKELCEKLNIEYKPIRQNERFNKQLAGAFDMRSVIEHFISENPVYYDKNKIWWVWNFEDLKWDMVDETDVLICVSDYTPELDTIKSKVKAEILEALKQIGRKRKPQEPPINWIQFKNKIVNINTGEQKTPTSKYFFINPINWNVGGSEETPSIDKLFIDWVGEENKQLLYEMIAYSLYRDYPIHRVFCLTGSGRNGKSKFLNLVSRFVGTDNRTSTDLDTLLENRFEVAKLYRKLVCELGETNYTALKKTALLKKLCGQDSIGFEFKNKNPFDDYNYSKIFIATNNVPLTHDKTDGFFRRWLIIDFPNKFPEGKDILATIPKEEYENLALKCIRLLKKLLDKGEFTNELSIENKRKTYEQKSNPFGSFMVEQTQENEYIEIPFYELFQAYVDFVRDRGYNEMSKSAFGKLLTEEGFEKYSKKIQGKTWYMIKGLSLKIKRKEHTEETEKQIKQQEEFSLLDYLEKFETMEYIRATNLYSEPYIKRLLAQGTIIEQPAGTLRVFK